MNLAVAFGDLNISSGLLYGLAAGMLAVGVVLLLWGWMVHRALLVLVGGGIGYLLGWSVARYFDWPILVTQGSLAVILAILLACLARIVWALLLAAILASLACGVVLHLNWPDAVEKARQAPELQKTQGLDEASQASQEYCRKVLKALWDDRPALLIPAASAAALIGLVIGLILVRFTRILMVSLYGAMLAMNGLLLAIMSAGSKVQDLVQTYWRIPVALWAVLLIGGMIVQYRSALAAEREEQSEEASPVEKRKKTQGDDE